MDRRLTASSGVDPATKSEYDHVEFWIRELDRLDRVLEKPAVSLIRLADEALKNGFGEDGKRIFTVPTTADEKDPRLGESAVFHAVVGSAVQRLHDQRRRFPWLKSHAEAFGRLRDGLPAGFLENAKLKATEPIDILGALPDVAFGTLRPLITSEVFWLLVRAGESYAHGDLGFLALFGLLWALKRRAHGPFE